jgi:CubicO group peptidase (beta-lactamase class C family)
MLTVSMRILAASAVAFIACIASASAGADGLEAAPGKTVDQTPPPAVTAAGVEDFVDRTVSAYMRDYHTAGAIVSVVDRNGSLLEKGYGIATLNPQRPVDPTRSLFCFGSISKTLTALAAMQLAGAGKLDLDADVNRYLAPGLQLPDNGFPPIRVRDLMTHSAGFEDSVLGDTTYAPEAAVPSLDDYLARYRPKRVRAPGLRAVYGNYASGLLGSIVAHVSGMSYESYVETNILVPLGMGHTTFREPLRRIRAISRERCATI